MPPLFRFAHGRFQVAPAHHGNHRLCSTLTKIACQQGLQLGAVLREHSPRELHVLHRSGVDARIELHQRIQHGCNSVAVHARRRIDGIRQSLPGKPSVGRRGGGLAKQCIGPVIDDHSQIGIQPRLLRLRHGHLANMIVNLLRHAVGFILVVAELGCPLQFPAQRFMAVVVCIARGHNLLQRAAPFVIDQLLDRNQAVGGVDVAIRLQRAAQVARAVLKNRQAACNAVVIEQAQKQERTRPAHHLVFNLLLHRQRFNVNLNLAAISRPKIREALE